MPTFTSPDKFKEHKQYVGLLKTALKQVKGDTKKKFLYFKEYPFGSKKFPLVLVDYDPKCPEALADLGHKPADEGIVSLTPQDKLDFEPKKGELKRSRLKKYFAAMGTDIKEVFVPQGEVDDEADKKPATATPIQAQPGQTAPPRPSTPAPPLPGNGPGQAPAQQTTWKPARPTKPAPTLPGTSPTQPATSEDELANFKQRLATLLPQIKAKPQVKVAAGTKEEKGLNVLASEAGIAAKNLDFARAKQLLDVVESALSQSPVVQGAVADTTPHPASKSSPLDQYKSALASPKLDSSDFILLSVDVLGKLLKDKPPAELNTISNQYQAQDYPGAIQGLLKVASSAQAVLGPDLVSFMTVKSKSLRDDPNQNQSRRFYETRLAAHLEDELNSSGAFRSLDGMRSVMTAKSKSAAGGRISIPDDPISSPKDAENLLKVICRFNDNIEMGLKADSDKYKAKDRAEKPVETTKGGAAVDKLSRNPGVMKANAPNFGDLVSTADAKNRVPDKNVIDKNKEGGYSVSSPAVPFVASASGTTFTLVALLEEYMKANQGDKNLPKNVNNMVKTFVAFYLKNGYHSYSEMVDVLNEKNIKAVFAQYGVTVDMTLPEGVLQKANSDAQAYAKVSSLQSATQAELTAKRPPTEPAAQSRDSAQPPPSTSAKPSALSLLKKGKVQTFSNKPGQFYVTFQSAEDLEAAAKQITEEHGAKAFRKAALANTIEIYAQLQSLLLPGGAAKNTPEPTKGTQPAEKGPAKQAIPVAKSGGASQPSPSTSATASALSLLKRGKLQTFPKKPGQVYVTFKSAEDLEAAANQIIAEHGADAFRRANLANTIEIYATLQNLLRT